MSLTIELPPDLQRQLEEDAARSGEGAAEYARKLLEQQLTSARSARNAETQIKRNQRAIALLQQWSDEDARDPDPDPVPTIPPLSLREVKID